jgi:hypothetical protein
MKKFVYFLLMILPVMACAQKVSVNKKGEKVKGKSAQGYVTELAGKKEDVSLAFSRFIKEMGRVRSDGDIQFVEGPALGGTVYSTGIVYAFSKGDEEKASVWLGIDSSEWKVNDITLVETQLEKLVYQFGVKFYRDKIQKQIDEGQQAHDAVVRQQQRLVNQNKDLNTKVINNHQQKINLVKSLEVNKLDSLVLQQKLINNKHDQDSVKLAGEQIKKVIEAHKERQRKVN